MKRVGIFAFGQGRGIFRGCLEAYLEYDDKQRKENNEVIGQTL